MEESQPPVQAPIQSPPPSNAVKTSKFSMKTIIGIIIFLLLAGGATAGFVYHEPIMKLVSQPTPTPTPSLITKQSIPSQKLSFTTYANHTYEYLFQYPSTWHVFSVNDQWGGIDKEAKDLDLVYITIDDLTGSMDINSIPDGIHLIHQENPDRLSPEEYIKKVVIPQNNLDLENTPEELIKNAKIETKNIRYEKMSNYNIDAVIVHGLNNVGAGFGNVGPEMYIAIPKSPNRILRIVSSNLDKNRKGPSETFLSDQILSTFKFTDQIPSDGGFSAEGQNCGPNAGAAGNAMCEPNLKCQYATAQAEQDKIGTCVK